MSASDVTAPTPRRRRDAAATREAILGSALVAFTRYGYDGVGVREIARAAGVTAMLVNRYFGSKEQLFVEVVNTVFSHRTLIGDDPATLARQVAGALVAPPPGAVDGFQLMLRSVANPQAAAILRDAIAEHFERHLAELLPGAGARERAALFLSVIAGFQLMREVLGSATLAAASDDHLAARLESLLRTLA